MNAAQPPKPRIVIADTSESPHAVMQPVGLEEVQMMGGFWQERRQANRDASLGAIGDMTRRTGRIENLRRAAGLAEGDFEGRFYNDSDVYKWMEAVFWSLAEHPNPKLEAEMDEVIDVIAAAQMPDGYINTYFQLGRMEERWTDFSMHELYCGGHLIQAAIADLRVRGKTRLFECAVKFADHVVDRFGSGETFGAPGHQLIEMALVELFRVTRTESYLALAERFIEARGQQKVHLHRLLMWRDPSYHQDHVPLREATRLTGHAVRQVYYLAGAADLLAERSDEGLSVALDRLWHSMVRSQMHLGGGLGSRWEVEGFGDDNELPNHHAHCESCASIGSFMWNWRMLQNTGDARYGDLCEHILYNSGISGVSLDGRKFFYQNPLGDTGQHRRQGWFEVACCPSNIARFLAQLPGYMASRRDGGIAVHFYGDFTLRLAGDGSEQVDPTLTMRSAYPDSGTAEITVNAGFAGPLFLRIPDWAAGQTNCQVNGTEHDLGSAPGYARLDRDWQEGDVIRLHLPVEPRRVFAETRVRDLQNKVALMRGPVVYCVEDHDNEDSDAAHLILPDDAKIQLAEERDTLAGMSMLSTTALVPVTDDGTAPLYSSTRPEVLFERKQIRAIPYAFWGNRTAGGMQVWLHSSSETEHG